MTLKAILENRLLRMAGPLPATQMFLKSARVEEGLSRLTETTVEFISPDRSLDLGKIVGKEMTVEIMAADDSWRPFQGICIEAEYLGLYEGYGLYTAQLRPWLWMLTRTTDNRIFQNVSVDAIVKKVLGDYGFADLDMSLTRSYESRTYCVQYGESDFAFLSRLMEEEGLYYYFGVKNGKDTLHIADDIGAHRAIAGPEGLEFNYREARYRRTDDHVFEWQVAERVTPGKVTLGDYSFERPKGDLKVAKAMPRGSHSHKDFELYRYPGRHREGAPGEAHARIEMESHALRHQTRSAVANARMLAAGRTFRLDGHPRAAENQHYLVTRAVHLMQIETDYEDGETLGAILPGRLDLGAENHDTYRCQFEALPKSIPFRAPQDTPWPRIAGLMLARVVGPAGEEIHTDKHGRIKVQFPWDREGRADENSSCFVRVATPWTGRNWGFVAIPRIGQEVVIQFEDGDPDRPICTGMMYNADTMPPYELPKNMTRSGVKTNSSKGGNGFNELMMEDKAGEELVRFQAQKDYQQIVRNNATISIGEQQRDNGDLTQTIYRHKTETLRTGDMTFTVAAGNEIRSINKSQTETVGEDRTITIGNNCTTSIGTDQTLEIGKDMAVDVGMQVSIGAGMKIAINAGAEIVLSVGDSRIKLDPSGVTISGLIVQVEGKTITKVEGKTMLVLNGGLTMIN